MYDRGTTDLLLMCSDDYTHLGYVWQFARRSGGATDDAAAVAIGLRYIATLLEDGVIAVGEMRADLPGLALWSGPSNEIIRRIEHYIAALGREPTLGDNVYLVATALGDELVARLSAEA